MSGGQTLNTVGPLFIHGEDRSELLASRYRESLKVADEIGARTVAFPAASVGICRWPIGQGDLNSGRTE
ncbi:macro domain-containing protein [Streptomyces decoyicus]|uniref:macro domain-containing protein n=1 Tax=Streptomyces decoyicus TaxID=249567 RepID=UPI00381993DC